MKPKIIICCSHYPPAFKAGGPIQSIANMTFHLRDKYVFYVITSNEDLKSEVLKDVVPDKWHHFEKNSLNIIYLSKENHKPIRIKKLIDEVNPDKLFVNGIYSLAFTLYPALFFKNRTIIHVRGMLHAGAIKQKRIKKYFFIFILKYFFLSRKIQFCATDEFEKSRIATIFGKKYKVWIAGNFPAIHESIPSMTKVEGSMVMTSVGLVSKSKNHLLVLESLKAVKSKITWHIYGPILDEAYWRECKLVIAKLPSNISVFYGGAINPDFRWKVFESCHVSILPSESENFGHSLYESMIAGRPIITSKYTPWKGLELHSAGFNVDLSSESVRYYIEVMASFNQRQYDDFCSGCRSYALKVLDIGSIKDQYSFMFLNS